MYKLLKLAFKVEDVANKKSSDYLMSLCYSVHPFLYNDLVLIFAIIEENKDTSIIFEYPVQEFDFNIEELSSINKTMENNLKYANNELKFMGDLL